MPQERKLKGRELEEYQQREEYLEFEVKRKPTAAVLSVTKS